jgi:putative endonuclease
MKANPKIALGTKGEKIAADYLRKKGYRIISQNFQHRYTQIDLIAQKDDTFIFVEVKCRKNYKFGLPVEALTQRKLFSLQKGVQYYLHINKLYSVVVRLDLVGIEMDSDNMVKNITHIENIGS